MVNQSVREISETLHKFTLETATESSKMEHRAFRLSWMVTVAAMMVGVFYTTLLTRSLVKPVRQLVSGVKQIQSGNLNTQLQITSKDEIGVLTKSFNHMADELKEKEFIKNTFGQYVDPRIVRDILNNQSESLNGESREMTIQFSDIEEFTKICEHLTPAATVKFLNHFFSFMSQSVLNNKGIIDKYIGDSVMAFWGPPFCLESENAAMACLAALEQVSRLKEFNETLPGVLGLRRGLPRVNIRLGLCTGVVTLGSIGSQAARSYTVIGEPVNLASRLEQACKMYGTRIIISEETAQKVRGAMETRELDRIVPAGMRETTATIHELLGECGKVPDNILKMRDHFQNGLTQYRARSWDAALDAFKTCLALVPGDKPSLLFLERVNQFMRHGPDDGWGGEWKQTKVNTVKMADAPDA
jgi:adenylate cyclase